MLPEQKHSGISIDLGPCVFPCCRNKYIYCFLLWPRSVYTDAASLRLLACNAEEEAHKTSTPLTKQWNSIADTANQNCVKFATWYWYCIVRLRDDTIWQTTNTLVEHNVQFSCMKSAASSILWKFHFTLLQTRHTLEYDLV